uniref:Uncharacterized protein n=1 Tax=Romanomermis culicivorax TaxID=13658 RepID=A0A915IXW9_ROMCU
MQILSLFIILLDGMVAFEYFYYPINRDVNVTDLEYVHVNSKLENMLFKNYLKSIRPVKNFDTITKAFFYPSITHVDAFDEKQETMSIVGSLYLV